MKELKIGTLVWHNKYRRGITSFVGGDNGVYFEKVGYLEVPRIELFVKGDRVINTSWNGGVHDNNMYTFYDATTHNPNTKSKFTIQREDGTIIYATSIRHFKHSEVMKHETQRSSCKHQDCNTPRMFVERRKESTSVNKWLRHGRDRRRSSCKHPNYSNLPKNLPLFKPDSEKIYWENNSYPDIINYEQFRSHCEQLEQEHKALFGPTATEASNLLFDAIKTGSTTFDSIKNAMFKSIKRMKRVSELKDANVSRSIINTILKDEGLYDD